MERGRQVNKNIILIISIVILSILVITASFAYFSGRLSGTNESLHMGDGLNIEFVLDGGSGLNYTFDPLKMTSHASENYIDSDTSKGTVTLVNHSEYDSVTCEYEVWFKADGLFANEDGKNDLSIIAIRNDETPIETSLNNVLEDTDVKLASVILTVGQTDSEDGSKIDNWTFNFRHYILKEDIQNEHIGDEFKGHIYFKTIRCYDGKD